MNQEKRRQFNERFLQRLMARRPQDRGGLEQRLQTETNRLEPEAATEALVVDASGQSPRPRDLALETIVSRERPVLLHYQDGTFNTTDVTTLGTRSGRPGQPDETTRRRTGEVAAVDRADRRREFPERQGIRRHRLVRRARHRRHQPPRRELDRASGTGAIRVRRRHRRACDGSSLCNSHEYDDLAPDPSRICNSEGGALHRVYPADPATLRSSESIAVRRARKLVIEVAARRCAPTEVPL